MPNTARFAAQSDPDRNVQFRRQWTDPTASLRFQRDVEHVHALGPRPFGELLKEVGGAHDCMPDILERLARYRWATPALLKALGGDRFPPRHLHEVV